MFGPATEAVAILVVLAYSGVINELVPRGLYVVTNLAAAAFAIVLARTRGVSQEDMGLRRDRLGRGLRFGLIAAIAIGAVILALAAVPGLRHLFANSDDAGGSGGHFAFEVLVRVPIGTALPEELIFRGALLGLFLQRHSRLVATAITAVVFGLWHVLPTLHQASGGGTSWPHGGAALLTGDVLSAVVATTAAGFVFAWLRFRSDSVLAPVLAHASFDSFGLVAARFAAAHPA
jgi:membrane protease YdiL (CAAX protease family)